MEPNDLPDPTTLSYEQAKQELKEIVAALEAGSVPLEQALDLWQRGKLLEARCNLILNAATERIDAAEMTETLEQGREEDE